MISWRRVIVARVVASAATAASVVASVASVVSIVSVMSVASIASAQPTGGVVDVAVDPDRIVLGTDTAVTVRATVDGAPAQGARWTTTVGQIEPGSDGSA